MKKLKLYDQLINNTQCKIDDTLIAIANLNKNLQIYEGKKQSLTLEFEEEQKIANTMLHQIGNSAIFIMQYRTKQQLLDQQIQDTKTQIKNMQSTLNKHHIEKQRFQKLYELLVQKHKLKQQKIEASTLQDLIDITFL